MDVSDVPELVPARMVNEFAYCPRLFFLEWVQNRFADSGDTVEGSYHHRAVDRGSGAMPLPDDGEFIAARSVTLSSASMGLIAKLDLVESSDGYVRPVETKRGSPPKDSPGEAWEPDSVQLCVQGLLLREAGYQCDRGEIFYAEIRRRVTVQFDEVLVDRTLELLAELRTTASVDRAPLPLVDSPKCPRCSLVGICLPDETNALADRSSTAPRRLLPSDSAARPLYVTEQGAKVGIRGNRIEITHKQEVLLSSRLIDVSQLCIYGSVQVSSQLLRRLFAMEIPTCWFSYGGWFQGIAEGLPAKHVELRRRQLAIAHQGSVDIARKIVIGKIRNCRTLLRRNARVKQPDVLVSLDELAKKCRETMTLATLLGQEGAAARSYFSVFSSMLREDQALPGEAFHFDGRNRRPPLDAVNCLLSYVYSLLVKDLTTTIFSVGFDPYVGFYHRPRFGRPALALDLAEEFRPLVADSVVVGLINNKEVHQNDFIVRAGGVALTPDGRKSVLLAYERRLDTEVRHPIFGYRVTYRRVLEVQARLLGAHLLGEIPEYTAFETR